MESLETCCFESSGLVQLVHAKYCAHLIVLGLIIVTTVGEV